MSTCATCDNIPCRCACPPLADRVAELREWARSRIEHGKMTIQAQNAAGRHDLSSVAANEIRTLEAVLRILDGKETPT